MKIVVTTPTGRVGSRVVRLLLQAGVRPTLLLRDPSRLDGEDPVAAHADMGAIAARAVDEHRIGRTVFQSSVGAERRSGAGEIDGLAATEVALDATGASVLHCAAGCSSRTSSWTRTRWRRDCFA